MWQFAITISRLSDFYGEMDVYMVEYRSKDKNTTQDNLADIRFCSEKLLLTEI